MKLSIITINYNNLEGLRKTIDSVASQTWRDFEWIVVDGGSSDGSRELIEEYAAKGCFAWWCSEKDKGVYNAMNKGIKQAQGEFVNFLNSGDCYFEKTVLEKVFSTSINCDILYCNCAFGTFSKYHVPKLPDEITLTYLYKKSICHPSSFIRKQLLESIPYDEKYKIVSDWKNWLIWYTNGCSFEFKNILVSLFDTSGISSKGSELQNKERLEVLREVYPQYVLNVLNDYNSLQDRLVELSDCNSELYKVQKYVHKRRLYKRMINITLKIITFIDNC